MITKSQDSPTDTLHVLVWRYMAVITCDLHTVCTYVTCVIPIHRAVSCLGYILCTDDFIHCSCECKYRTLHLIETYTLTTWMLDNLNPKTLSEYRGTKHSRVYSLEYAHIYLFILIIKRNICLKYVMLCIE